MKHIYDFNSKLTMVSMYQLEGGSVDKQLGFIRKYESKFVWN